MSTEQFQKIINGGDVWAVVSVMFVIISEKQMTTHGRPSRILRFYLTKPRKTG